MKLRLLELVSCPLTHDELEVEIFETDAESIPDNQEIPTPACRYYCHRLHLEIATALPQCWPCWSCYGEEIVEGLLISKQSRNVYPIIQGAPRLIPQALDTYPEFVENHREHVEKYLSVEKVRELLSKLTVHSDKRSPLSFALQWHEYQIGDRTWFKNLELRRREFLQSMDLPADSLKDKVVLDAGCGHGALTAVIADYGLEAVGMDFTPAVGRAQKMREKFTATRAPFVHYLQGDLLNSPLVSERFDHVHCSGVIHHTPSPERAFDALFHATKPGGRLYVQVYRKREDWVGIANSILRAVTTHIPLKLLWYLCLLATPLHSLLVHIIAFSRGEKPILVGSSMRERAVSLFDNYSPRYQFRYHAAEVEAMFEEKGLKNIKDTTLENEARHMVALVGVKPNKD